MSASNSYPTSLSIESVLLEEGIVLDDHSVVHSNGNGGTSGCFSTEGTPRVMTTYDREWSIVLLSDNGVSLGEDGVLSASPAGEMRVTPEGTGIDGFGSLDESNGLFENCSNGSSACLLCGCSPWCCSSLSGYLYERQQRNDCEEEYSV
jgi:hypothetical protein